MLRHRIAVLGAVTALSLPAGTVHGQISPSVSPSVNYTSGTSLERRPAVSTRAYSSSSWVPRSYGSLDDPIFMTTISTPGIYGRYSFGTGGHEVMFNREPYFYPARDPRAFVPATSTTLVPMKSLNTPIDARVVRLTTNGPLTEAARIHVRVPGDARVYFQGVPTAPTGTDRDYTSPPLAVGRRYRYDVQAIWYDGTRRVVEDRQVMLRAGDRVDVDFFSPVPETRTPTLRSVPLPRPVSAGKTPPPTPKKPAPLPPEPTGPIDQ